jgi:hypothetical protein
MQTSALTIRRALVTVGLAAFMQAASGGNQVDLTLQQIMAPREPDQDSCFDSPRYDAQARSSWALALVTTSTRPRTNGVCRDWQMGQELAIYRNYDGRYREIKVIKAGDGILVAKLFVYHGTVTKPIPEQVLLGVENELSGTGNFREYQLYRFTRNDALEPIPIISAAEVLAPRLEKSQGIVGPGYSFDDEQITFAMSITNGSESTRFPSGGSAYGEMILVNAAQGLTLIPDAGSLQMPSESSRLNELGLAAYRAEKFDQALDYYRSALAWHRSNYEAASNLGLLYLRRKEWNAAVEVSARVVEAKDASRATRASAAYNAGRAFESAGDRKRAAASYRKAVEFQDSPERRAALARICPGANDCD